jgi:hypothetical protein
MVSTCASVAANATTELSLATSLPILPYFEPDVPWPHAATATTAAAIAKNLNVFMFAYRLLLLFLRLK